MKSFRWGFVFAIAALLFISSSTPVFAGKFKDIATTQEFILSFDDHSESTGEISPMTISSSTLKITVKSLAHRKADGTVAYLDVDVVWEWLNNPGTYQEDTIAISWDTYSVQWRCYTTSIFRNNYYKYMGSSTWIHGTYETSVEDTRSNGFIYDQLLMRMGTDNPPTLNKGEIHFDLSATTSTSGTSSETLYVNYFHKYTTLAFNGAVNIGNIATGGTFTPSFTWGFMSDFDSRGVSVSLPY